MQNQPRGYRAIEVAEPIFSGFFKGYNSLLLRKILFN